MWICPECRQIYDDDVVRCERDDAPVAEVYAHQTKARYPLLGRIVGERYHLIGGLGQGGLGTVYLAQHRHLGQLFAVKFLELQSLGAGSELDDGQKSGYRRDFLKEAQVASLVRHPSVVRVTDFGEHDGMPFLVMEYVPGPSLLQMLGSRGRFPVPEAVAIGRRIAEALDAFHERRLVHRDLKPANVILDPRGDGRLTLVDLGLVKDLSGIGAKASTHPLALRGTPGYLAPEQVPPWVLAQQGVKSVNEKRIVDARVDLYALGVIFYEMLAGVSPYPDGSNTAVIVYACTRDPIPFSTVDPPVRVPAALEALVYETMHRDPERRPSSAAAFLERLDALTMGQAVQGSWPAIIAPGVRSGGGGAPAGPKAGQPADPLAGLGRLVPTNHGHDLDAEEALESTAVFTDIDVALPASGSDSGPAVTPLESSAGRAPGSSAERRRAAESGADALGVRKAAAAPDRTLEADVLDPEDLPHDPEDLPRDADDLPRDADDLPRDADDLPRDADDLPRDADERAPTGERPLAPAPRAARSAPEDADFEFEARTEVERVSPGLRPSAPPKSPSAAPTPAAPVAPPVSVPREIPRAESVRRPAAPRRSPWRIPVAVGLVGAAAATGWLFARQQDTAAEPEVHVVRIGSGDAGPSAPSAPSAPPSEAVAPAAESPPASAPPAAPESAAIPPTSARVDGNAPPSAAVSPGTEPGAAPESAARRKPPPGGIEQLVTEGNAAMEAGQFKTALERYEAFMKRAGEGHPKYWELQPRVEWLREKLNEKPKGK